MLPLNYKVFRQDLLEMALTLAGTRTKRKENYANCKPPAQHVSSKVVCVCVYYSISETRYNFSKGYVEAKRQILAETECWDKIVSRPTK